MPQAPDWTRRIFFSAAAVNIIGITLFSQGFSNTLGAVDPLFSPHGCRLVAVWGLAYLSIAWTYAQTPWTSFVFALEKAFYGFAWIRFWMTTPDVVERVSSAHPLTGAFFGVYGIIDIFYGLFFAWVWWRHRAVGSR